MFGNFAKTNTLPWKTTPYYYCRPMFGCITTITSNFMEVFVVEYHILQAKVERSNDVSLR